MVHEEEGGNPEDKALRGSDRDSFLYRPRLKMWNEEMREDGVKLVDCTAEAVCVAPLTSGELCWGTPAENLATHVSNLRNSIPTGFKNRRVF